MVKVNKVVVIVITVIMKVMEVMVLITKIIPITSTINDIVISMIHASLVWNEGLNGKFWYDIKSNWANNVGFLTSRGEC